ncbi:MAG: hypothetical protein ACK5V3_08590 [Bdellovibrionales bacterium]
MKNFLIIGLLISSSFAMANSRKLNLVELNCKGVKIKLFPEEKNSGIHLQLIPLSSDPSETVINMRAGVYPSKNWVNLPVFVNKVSPLKGGGFQLSGKPRVVFAGGGSSDFNMNVVKQNNIWKASATVVYKAWSRPASIRDYKLTCTEFKVQ